MTTALPDMGQIGSDIQTRLTNLESETQSNETNLAALEQQIIAVCNEVSTGAQASNLSEEE